MKYCDICHLSIQAINSKPQLFTSVWCSTCILSWMRSTRCQRCGVKLPSFHPQNNCGQCMLEQYAWDHLYCVGNYSYPLDRYVHQFKYRKYYQLCYPLAEQLAVHIQQPAPLLIPVPLHWRRFIKRGFNQSVYLAYGLQKAFAKMYQIEVTVGRAYRKLATVPQKGLPKKDRYRNVRQAFMIQSLNIAVSHIAIVDDVVTTGSTVNELCNLYRKSGIEQIDIYCICRAS